MHTFTSVAAGIKASLLASVLLFLVTCGSDAGSRDTDWVVEERAFPAPPAEIDRPVVWHFIEERVEPEVESSADVWGETSYRVSLKFQSELPRPDRETLDSEGLSSLHDGPLYVGFGEPFFEDGQIHMFETGSNPDQKVYKFDQLELRRFPFGLGGHVVYPAGHEGRTEAYSPGSGIDLPVGLSEWYELGRPTITAYVFKPGPRFWIEYRLVPRDCTDAVQSCFESADIRDFSDPRLLWLGALRDIDIYR